MGAGDWGKMLPEPDLLGKYFHEQFKVLPDHQRLDLCIYIFFSDKQDGRLTSRKDLHYVENFSDR